MGSSLEPAREGSSGSSGSRDAERQAVLLSKKQSRPEGGHADVTDRGAGALAFSLPPCFVEKDFFEGFPLTVFDNDSNIIRRLDKEGRRKHLAACMVWVVKMADMVVVLAGEGLDSSDRVRELESEKANHVTKTCKLKTALEQSEEMFREQVDMLAGENERAEKALKDKGCLHINKEWLESDNQRMEKEVAYLKAGMMPAEGEPEGVSDLHTRGDFIARIQLLECDYVDALADGFESVVNQLFVLNLGLNTEGTGVLSQVIDGRVVPPPDSPEVEVSTPGSD